MWTKIQRFLFEGARNSEELQTTDNRGDRSGDEPSEEISIQVVATEEAGGSVHHIEALSEDPKGVYSVARENHEVMSNESIQAEAPKVPKSATAKLKKFKGDKPSQQAKDLDSNTTQSLPHRLRTSLPLSEDGQPDSVEASDLVAQDEAAAAATATAEDKGLDHSIETTIVKSKGKGIKTSKSTNSAPASNQIAKIESLPASSSSPKTSAKRKRINGAATSINTAPAASISIHKRFNSEEPTLEPESNEITTQDLAKDTVSDKADSQSEDDAPEEISGTAAAQQAKASAARAAQSVKSQRESDRAKRQKRDLELKTQSQRAKKRKLDSNHAIAPATSPSLEVDSPELLQDFEDELPDELPEEILAMDHETTLESLPVPSSRIKALNKRKRLDQDPKPTKDVRVGNKNIRVLSSSNPSLPPAADRQTKNMKEAWLKARTIEARTKVAGYRIKGGGARSFLRS